ncbi:hypothetical protein ACFFUS_14085 [Vibrio gallaecicus]|uniref:hypothetical protein n=2 Tax=Vibrio gallaecicus TaxID=552386 RepID=UPI0010C9C923|nr:hypothetical protein [Vibrio gallaecicus]
MCDYPDFYPEDMPPENAIDANGEAYRLVDNNPPQKVDFRSTIEENPKRAAKKPSDREMLYGASLFTRQEEALKKKKLFKPLRNKTLSAGHLSSDDGMMKKTGGPCHITVWFKKEALPHERFECIEE